MQVVRNWLNAQNGMHAPGPAAVWGAFLDFMTDNYTELKRRGYSKRNIDHLPIDELAACMSAWTSKRHARRSRKKH